MEKCLELLNAAKDELKDVEGSEDAVAKIDEAIAATSELYPADEMDKEEKGMLDSGKYKRGGKSGILIEVAFGKHKDKE